jgi:hypothetical protein
MELERQAAAERVKARYQEAHELEIDAEVEAERDRQAREAAKAAERDRQARVRDEISGEVETWMQALAEAENGAVKMVAALKEAFEAGRRINTLVGSLGGMRDRLSSKETADRLSKQISRLLAGIDQSTHFGSFQLDAFMLDLGTSWSEGERRNARWLAEFVKQGDTK